MLSFMFTSGALDVIVKSIVGSMLEALCVLKKEDVERDYPSDVKLDCSQRIEKNGEIFLGKVS